MLRYTAHQLMVDTVLRLQVRCDEKKTKFQQHENLSLPSSHRNMKATFPEVLSPKRGQILSQGQKSYICNTVKKPYIKKLFMAVIPLDFVHFTLPTHGNR